MITKELLSFLRRAEAQDVLFYPLATLRAAFPGDSEMAFERALHRHIADGLLDRPARGLFASPRARIEPACPWSAFVSALRPLESSYLSLEYRLSELGCISQISQVVTISTSGKAGLFGTPYGQVELATRRSPAPPGSLAWDRERSCWIASPRRAYEDLKALHRPTIDLVDQEELAEAEATFQAERGQAHAA